MIRWNALLHKDAHRPWPLPPRPWVMTMSWVDLLFAHWHVPADALRALLPAGLELDTFEGRAWLGVVPGARTGTTCLARIRIEQAPSYRSEPDLRLVMRKSNSQTAVL